MVNRLIEAAQHMLEETDNIMPQDNSFPMRYHNAWIKKCLSNSVASDITEKEIEQYVKEWGSLYGPAAYACQLIEGACKEVFRDRFYREMPQPILDGLSRTLRGPNVSFVDFVKDKYRTYVLADSAAQPSLFY